MVKTSSNLSPHKQLIILRWIDTRGKRKSAKSETTAELARRKPKPASVSVAEGYKEEGRIDGGQRKSR